MRTKDKTGIDKYPQEVQTIINSAKEMTRGDIVNYFDKIIEYYKAYNAEHPNMSWAKDYPRNYEEKKIEVLKEFDTTGIACYLKDFNHYGHGFDCEDIDVYLYTDGSYSVSHYSYSAY